MSDASSRIPATLGAWLLLAGIAGAQEGLLQDEALFPEGDPMFDEGALIDPYGSEEMSWAPQGDDPLQWIFYHYGTACFGMDWRFLEAIARAESGLDSRRRNGGYVGLFQWSQTACREPANLGPFDFLSCDDLTDPEANTLAAAHRFHRMFWGERFIGGELVEDSSWPLPMVQVCPGASVGALAALAYVGHNNGPGVLKHVLSYLQREGRGCELEVQEAAVRDYYENSAGTRAATAADVAECNRHANVAGRPARELVVGMRHRRCVNASYGAEKWQYGVDRVLPEIEASGVVDVYPDGAFFDDDCPIYDGRRVYDNWDWTLLE